MNAGRVPTGVFISVTLVTVLLLGAQGVFSPAAGSSPETYTINGLTCSLAGGNVLGSVNNDSRVPPTIRNVIHSPSFLSTAKGLPYGLYYAGVDTVGTISYANGTTVSPPATHVLELGFATWGPNTLCVNHGRWLNWIDVQVPLINGTYDVTAEHIGISGPK